MKRTSRVLINGISKTRKFKTESDIHRTSTWFTTTLYDNKPFNSDDIRVNGLGEYFIALSDDMKERIYFKDIKVFNFIK